MLGTCVCGSLQQLGQFAMHVAFGVSKRFAISIGACNILSVFLGSFLLVGLKDQLESSEAVDYIPTFAGECRGRDVVVVFAEW